MNEYKAYNYQNKTLYIEKYILLGEQHCRSTEYNLFDTQLDTFAVEKINDIAENRYENYELFTDQNDELLNSFKNYPQSESKKVFLYTEVSSKTKTKIIVNIMCSKWGKFWVNGKCLSIHHYDWANPYYVTVYLRKGKNVFLLEQYSPKESSLFSIQLRNYKFEMSNNFKALSNVGSNLQINPLILINQDLYNVSDIKYKFMYMKNDNETYDENYKIDIYDSHTGFVRSLNANINDVVEIDIAELRYLHKETLRHEWFGCTFKTKDKRDFTTGFCVILNDFDERRLEINNLAIAYGNELPLEIHESIQGRLIRQIHAFNSKDTNSLYWYTWQLKDIISWIENGSYPYNYFKKPGVQEFYIHSDLDDCSIRMLAYIPQNYDQNKSYPIILALSTGNDGWFCWGPIEENITEPCICFDVTGRGFTGGSYIGETSILQILDWIKANFMIDEERIYILGQSNGGYATYSIAQKYPHLAAAIYPHIGYPYMETVRNLLNTPTYQTVSSKDHVFSGHEYEVKNAINKYGNYHQYDFNEMNHHSFIQYIYHKDILNSMLKIKRNLFPENIFFVTEQNRYLESFWIRLHGIKKKYISAKIKANIINNKLIKIYVRGTNGITVKIPPQMEREFFIICINNKEFVFKQSTGDKLIFIKDMKWIITEHELPVDYRKGTGILDVYLNNMRIILPENETAILRKTAESFAKPFTSGTDPVVYTNYPIYRDDDVPRHIFAHNLILLDMLENNQYIKRLKDKLLVHYDDNGYEYNGTRVDADYVIMQVVPNPYNDTLSILIISANNENLLKRNLFTRKVVLPFYANGIHPYWNNEALIFDGKKYWGIYERGVDIEEIK